MSDSTSLVGFLSEPSTLMALGAVAVGTAWYLSSSGTPTQPPFPLDNQTIEVREEGCVCCPLTPDVLQLDGKVRTSHAAAKNGLMKFFFKDVTTLYDTFQRGKRVSSKTTPTHSHSNIPFLFQTMAHVLVRGLAPLDHMCGCPMVRWRRGHWPLGQA